MSKNISRQIGQFKKRRSRALSIEALEMRRLLATDSGNILPYFRFDQSFEQIGTAPFLGDTYDLIAEDFNNDGMSDLSASSWYDPSGVITTLSNSNFNFSPQTFFSLPQQSGTLRAGDLNSDGYQDLIVAHEGANGVFVLLNNGSGAFNYGSFVPLPASVTGLAIGDLDNDGDLDAVAGVYAAGGIYVLTNTGSGSFYISNGYSLPHSKAVEIADFDNDGNLDVASTQMNWNAVTVYFNSGYGTFGQPATFSSGGGGPLYLKKGHFNNDNFIDLAIANNYSNSITTLRNNGNRTFSTLANFSVNGSAKHLSVGDLNRDGFAEISTLTWQTLYCINTKDGTLVTQQVLSDKQTAIGDFNGDSVPEIAAKTADGQTLNFYGYRSIDTLKMDEDSVPLSVPLWEIYAGGKETQNLQVTAISNNNALIPDPTVFYTPNATSGQIVIAPQSNMSGEAVITVTVTDGGLDNNLATTADNSSFSRTLNVTVDPVNDPPVAEPDWYTININEPSLLAIAANDHDVDGNFDPLGLEIVSQPKGGTIELIDDQIEFTPNHTQLGEDSFTYRIRDLDGVFSEIAMVTLQLNEHPETVPDHASVRRDQTVDIDVLANDQFILSPLNPSSLEIATAPSQGTAIPVNGKIRFSPATRFLGETSFSYTVRNQLGIISAPTTVQITVAGSKYQNPQQKMDVNSNSYINSTDVLIIINNLRAYGVREVSELKGDVKYFYDVNGDFHINSMDALIIINYLIHKSNLVEAEGESNDTPITTADSRGSVPSDASLNYIVDLLADDHLQKKKRLSWAG